MRTRNFLVAILLVLSIASCGRKEPNVIKIGAVLPLTGSGAEFGKDELVGAQIAVDRINSSSSNIKLDLLVEDSRTQANDGVLAFRKIMALETKPIAMLTVMSSVSSALAPIAEENKMVLFCVAAAPDLTKERKYIFRTLPTSSYQAETLLKLSKATLKYKSVAILYVTDDFGVSMEASFSAVAKENEVNILRSEGIQTGSSDFRTILTKLINANSDAIYIAAFGSQLGTAVRQIRELGYKRTILTTLEIGYQKVLDLARKSAEGAYFVDTRFNASSTDSATVLFVEEFKKRTSRMPSLDAVLAYDEVQMIYSAGLRKGFNTEAIRTGLLEIKDYKSLNGNASMMPNGDVAYELILKVIRNGQPISWNGE